MARCEKRSSEIRTPGLGVLTRPCPTDSSMPNHTKRDIERALSRIGAPDYSDIPRMSIAQALSFPPDSDAIEEVEGPDGRTLYLVNGELHRPFGDLDTDGEDDG